MRYEKTRNVDFNLFKHSFDVHNHVSVTIRCQHYATFKNQGAANSANPANFRIESLATFATPATLEEKNNKRAPQSRKVAEVATPLNSKNDKQWNEVKPIIENSGGMVVDEVVTRNSLSVRHVV
ncbi:MAG: hypothetical protein ACXV8Q_09775 [Methylobacter sp.]